MPLATDNIGVDVARFISGGVELQQSLGFASIVSVCARQTSTSGSRWSIALISLPNPCLHTSGIAWR